MKTFRTSRQWAMGMAVIFLMGILFAAVNYGCSRGCSQQEAEQKQATAVTGSIPDTASEEQAGVSETEGKVLVARTESEDRDVVSDSSSENRIIDAGTASGVQAGVASSLQSPTAQRQVAKTAPKPRGSLAWAAPANKSSEVPRETTPRDRQGSEVEGSEVPVSEPQAVVAAAPPPPPVFAQQAAADPQGPPVNLGPGCYKKLLGEDAGIYQNFKEGHSANASEWQYVGPSCELDNMGPGCYKRLHGEQNEVVYQYFKHGRPFGASGWTWVGYCCGSYGQ